MAVIMRDFKRQVLEGKPPKLFCSDACANPDLKHLGVYLLTRVIPEMEKRNEVAFVWHIVGKDVVCYTQKHYDVETGNYVNNHNMKVSKGDTTWFYDFKNKDGKMRRCILTTEIWYKKNAYHSVSPMAMLFGQFMGNGLHITKCKFEDV